VITHRQISCLHVNIARGGLFCVINNFLTFWQKNVTLRLTVIKLWCIKLCAFFFCNTLYNTTNFTSLLLLLLLLPLQILLLVLKLLLLDQRFSVSTDRQSTQQISRHIKMADKNDKENQSKKRLQPKDKPAFFPPFHAQTLHRTPETALQFNTQNKLQGALKNSSHICCSRYNTVKKLKLVRTRKPS